MKASDLFVKCLENEGIRYIFGLPGEENVDLMMSLRGSPIRFVLCRHEQGAAFMAEVYGRLVGNPAVALGTLGPGATNLLTGAADANMDRAPMIVVTGQAATTRQHKESHQVINIVELYRPVTKWATSIRHPDNIPEVIRKAVRVSRSEKPGAVMIELPENIAEMQTTGQPMPVRRYRRPAPEDKVIHQACDVIRNAKRPLILAGNGTIRKRASRQLRQFCQKTGIGVVSTFMAKGCVDCAADYCLFTIGLQTRDHVTCAVDNADLIITVGYDMVEYPPRLWNPIGRERIIHIDFDPAEIDEHYNPHVELVGDIAHGLQALEARLEAGGIPPFDFEYQRRMRQLMVEDFVVHADDDTTGSIRPQKAIWDVREALGPHDILLSGVGAHKLWIGRYYQCHEPNTCIIPNGFCSMGIPLPGAIAAHRVITEGLDDGPTDRKVFAIVGDGDFLMNVQEMETARRLNADINIMVWEDGEYGLISWKQDVEFGSHTDLAFGNPDWMKLAESFDWQGQYVTDARDLGPALHRALAHKGPSLIVIPIDYRENMKLTERLGKIACPI
ncbi:MAG: acetolactate synthase large subunit [Phycisphaeraceae bacterium]|nr:acetolactate synthase large subunit [Phycisphaeraceae bacterium]